MQNEAYRNENARLL
jgi:hypothetical protein